MNIRLSIQDQDSSVASAAGMGSLRVLETCAELVEKQTPNLLRLYLNPWVAQTCLCLNHYAQSLVHPPDLQPEDCPSFLANSREEALSGAVKLARFAIHSRAPRRRSPAVIVIDPRHRFPHFGYSVRDDGSRAEYIPDIMRCEEGEVPEVLRRQPDAGILVLADGAQDVANDAALRDLWLDPDVITIRCIDTDCVPADSADRSAVRADILVFDESFVDDDLAFAAFTARRSLFAAWLDRRMSMFHSTTFQPNSLTTMHFMRCLQIRDPRTALVLQEPLSRVVTDIAARHAVYRRLYNPSLSRLIARTGFDTAEPLAIGHTVTVGSKKIFDGVAGVACSLRGHNPPLFAQETRETVSADIDLEFEISERLRGLTGLAHHVPAVSGASAVEQALQLAISIQPARPHVLALQGGFGGKTLGALTGTSRSRYRIKIGPLYQDVSYVDPFSKTAVDDLLCVLQQHPVGVVQVELIQGVGGVREVPEPVLETLQQQRNVHDFVLFADEVQTGMFRTGSFVRSIDVGICPDILTIGKGTSDTMFPFALTLYNDTVQERLLLHNPELPRWLKQRYASPSSYAGLLNTLLRAEQENWSERVRKQGALFHQQLNRQLADCKNVADIRVFGMLIGIELNLSRALHRITGKRAASLYSLAMLNHPRNPSLIGFCQYEPHVFKLTPGLLMDDAEIKTLCGAVAETLQRSPWSVFAEGVWSLATNRKS